MKIYIDEKYKCHVSPGEGLTEIETDCFDGKCDTYIKGYCYIPEGHTLLLDSGNVCRGSAFFPWKQWTELDEAQREYERQQLMDANAQNAELLETMAAMVEEVYESDLEVFQWGGDGL